MFALCTVLSSVAVSWVIDNVIQPRFDEGEVARSTLITGIVFITVRRRRAGRRRGGAAHVRRHHAVAPSPATLGREVVDRLVRQPDVVASAATRRRPRRPRPVSTPTLAPTCSPPSPFATGTVLMIVVSAVWLLATDWVLGVVAVARVPDAHRRST